MLILTRKNKQRIDIVIDGHCVASVAVLRIGGGNVRLGMTGQDDVNFRRGELSDRPIAEGVPSGSFAVDT